MAEHICLMCGYEGGPRKTKRGSRSMEIFIWSILLIPGPLYSLWRRVALPKVCPNCSAPKMVSATSDAGQIKQRQIDADLGITIARPVDSMVLSDPSHSRMWADTKDRPKPTIDPDQW